MAKQPAPTIEELEKKADEVMTVADLNNDKKISLEEFVAYCSKDKVMLAALDSYNILSKDDLRPDFGGADQANELPDCDSDLENEIQSTQEDRDEQTTLRKSGIESKVLFISAL